MNTYPTTLDDLCHRVAEVAAHFPLNHEAMRELDRYGLLKSEGGRKLALLSWLMKWQFTDVKKEQ